MRKRILGIAYSQRMVALGTALVAYLAPPQGIAAPPVTASPKDGIIWGAPYIEITRKGPTVISTDGEYTEDTTVVIRAMSSYLEGATVLTDFVGTIDIVESGGNFYSQYNGSIPAHVAITAEGKAEFTIKSQAGPRIHPTDEEVDLPMPPGTALITVSNHAVYGIPLLVKQWVFEKKIDSRAEENTYDWLEARMKDYFDANPSGPKGAVLSKVSNYAMGDNMSVAGSVFPAHTTQSRITINPYNRYLRRGVAGNLSRCGHSSDNDFTNTVLHEARHAYQNYLTTLASNDEDGDYLTASTAPINPASIIQDTSAERNGCNPISGELIPITFLGDSTPDDETNVKYVREEDAYQFADSHD